VSLSVASVPVFAVGYKWGTAVPPSIPISALPIIKSVASTTATVAAPVNVV
jgi:hypothetical protein